MTWRGEVLKMFNYVEPANERSWQLEREEYGG
jgi:hypothetical protein